MEPSYFLLLLQINKKHRLSKLLKYLKLRLVSNLKSYTMVGLLVAALGLDNYEQAGKDGTEGEHGQDVAASADAALLAGATLAGGGGGAEVGGALAVGPASAGGPAAAAADLAALASTGGDGGGVVALAVGAALAVRPALGARLLGTAAARRSSSLLGGGVDEVGLLSQVGADDSLVDDLAHDGLDVHAGLLHLGEHLLVGGGDGLLLAGDNGVGDQGQAQHLHAAVLGRHHLGHGGHAHGVTADGAQEAALGLGLVARAADEAVRTVGADLVGQVELLGGGQHHVLQHLVVRITHGGEAGTKGVIVHAAKGVVSSQGGLME
jgi:hypothetical protein